MFSRSILPILSIAFAASWPALNHAAEPAKVKAVAEKLVIAFPEGARGTPAYLKAMKVRFETPDTKIGELQKGCRPASI